MILFIGLSIIHVAAFCWLLYHWMRIPVVKSISPSDKIFTVLIPIRNEAANIKQLLLDINKQSYPRDRFEVIVIDDYSEDDTAAIVQQLISVMGFDLKYLAPEGKVGKKSAISRGVAQSKYEYILTTDGDCSAPRDWIAAYASYYDITNATMLTGPVCMTGKGILPLFQSVEFASLIGFGAAALHSGNPSMCNGANMSYRKSVFLEVGGYDGNEQIPSGDDEFLLQKIFKLYPKNVKFLKSHNATVSTPAKESLSELVNQRVRWSSKWKYHKSWFIKGAAIFAFCDFLALIVMFMLSVLGRVDANQFFVLLIGRWLIDVVFLYCVGRFFKIPHLKTIGVSFLLEIIYPVFVSLLGIASIFVKYSWKGRKY